MRIVPDDLKNLRVEHCNIGYFRRSGQSAGTIVVSTVVQRLSVERRHAQRVESWTNWSDVSDTGHTCSGVPARHILELLYTTALGTQGQPIHQVVGARTRIDTESWPLNVNLEDTTISHDFLLTSSVVFVQVPISDSPPRSSDIVGWSPSDIGDWCLSDIRDQCLWCGSLC
uniref:Uncharacterized protein n=1 Tax=Timema bartmani TaxID=61472 RepID=A0A7R9F7Y2_9NEOP|nr:unnamed protein product [Timema bartmani]